MTIFEFEPQWETQWLALFTNYFTEDLECGLSTNIIQNKICPFILNQREKGILEIALAVEGNTVIGFSVYQIDTTESDWCKRPGWGFIREFYIAPSHRLHGLGRSLANHTEAKLRNMGAAKIYLTTDTASLFWTRCGYTDSDELCSNDGLIFTK